MGRPLECACVQLALRACRPAAGNAARRNMRRSMRCQGQALPPLCALQTTLHLVIREQRVPLHVEELTLVCSPQKQRTNTSWRAAQARLLRGGRHQHVCFRWAMGQRVAAAGQALLLPATGPQGGPLCLSFSPLDRNPPGCGRRAGGGGVCSAASRHSSSFSQRSTLSPREYLREAGGRGGHLQVSLLYRGCAAAGKHIDASKAAQRQHSALPASGRCRAGGG